MAYESVKDLLTSYREAAEGTSAPEPKIANKCQRKLHACYKRLRETPEGRTGIILLMKDSSPYIRCWAAAHSLQWESLEAQKTLEELQKSCGPCAFDAEMTLQQFHNGSLSFEY